MTPSENRESITRALKRLKYSSQDRIDSDPAARILLAEAAGDSQKAIAYGKARIKELTKAHIAATLASALRILRARGKCSGAVARSSMGKAISPRREGAATFSVVGALLRASLPYGVEIYVAARQELERACGMGMLEFNEKYNMLAITAAFKAAEASVLRG